MGMRDLLEAQWPKAGIRSGVGDFKYISTVEALITLFRDDGLWLTASSQSLDGGEVKQFLGRKFAALVNPSQKSGDISAEDSIGVIVDAGKQLSESDDTVRIITRDLAPQAGVSIGGGLLGLDITFPARTSPLGFISGEITVDAHSYFCVVKFFVGKKQI
jgi:hypothetical protein